MAFWDTPGRSDEWYTPKHVFDALSVVFDQDVVRRRGHALLYLHEIS